MKKLLFILTAIIGVTFLVSCSSEEKDPVLDMSLTTKPVITSPANGLVVVLLQDSAETMFPSFKWNPAEYNLKNLENTKYILQLDMEGNNFASPIDLVSSTEAMFELTDSAMNVKLIAFGINPDTAKNVQLRVHAFINDASGYTDVYSEAVTITVTTYKESGGTVEYPKLYVPGAYQGWNPGGAPMIYDFDNDGVYNGYFMIASDATDFNFKFTSAPNWDGTNYGAGVGEGILSTDNNAGNLSVPGPGTYKVSVDINNLTWTYEVESWGVIGEWLSWSSDIDMVYDFDNHYFSATVADIPAADNQRFKFRANDAWDINLGAKDPDDGFLVPGGKDIPIPAGGTITFILKFDTPEPGYQFISKK
jgi:hypothetical protein